MDEVGLGKAIQRARQNAGLTQQQLCQKASLSYSTLAKIERGAIRTPSVFTVYKIAATLGISIDGLLGATVDAASIKKISKTGISFIYFDINGCLVRFFHGAFTQIAIDTGLSGDVIESAFWHFNDAVCRGDITLDEFNSSFAKQIGLDSMDWNKYYLNAVESIQQMHDLVTWSSKHYRIGLLSNIMPGQIKQMINLGLIPDVKYDSIIDSSEVNAIKPEPQIYIKAEKKAGANPSEILFIDDSRTNLMAAERRGWKVLWFNDLEPTQSTDKVRATLDF